MTELEEVLQMVKGLIKQPRTKQRLMDQSGVSARTLTRRIAEARHLGVKLESRQMEVNEAGRLTGPYYWHVLNADEIDKQLNSWLALEQARDLRSPTKEEAS